MQNFDDWYGWTFGNGHVCPDCSSIHVLFFRGSVAVIPIQGQFGYGSSNMLGGSVVNPDEIKEQIKTAESDRW